jgi:hypothetical protein
MTTKTVPSWEWDVRVRDRNLKKGLFNEKDVDKHLATLPDGADACDSVNVTQPGIEEDDPSDIDEE